ncbi:META domain-containing protein [Egbenema bharatensis]|uniref:META domain-containing protein n=1 Tax=Egbenema bharatensis TaxID=3463334 RepID=UPI003A86C9DC
MNKHSRYQSLTGGFVVLTLGLVQMVAAIPGLAVPLLEEQLMAQTASITGNWRLVSITESATPTPMVPPQTTELTADFSGDRITGSGGCNRFMGGFTTAGEQLNVGPLATTFMACEAAVMDQEMRYLAALQGAQRYEVDDQGQLAIFYQTEQGTGILRFTSAQAVRGLW